MKIKILAFTLVFLFLADLSSELKAQQTYFYINTSGKRKIELTSGSTKFLKNVQKINISYDYSEMAVGRFKTESRYLQQVLEEKGDEEGSAFIRKWKTWPEELFEPRFLMVFLKKIGDYPLSAYNYSTDGDVNLLVKVISENPESRSTRRHIVVDCIFSDRKDQPLAVFRLTITGSHEFDMSEGLAECYGFAGGTLAREIKRLVRIERERAKNGY